MSTSCNGCTVELWLHPGKAGTIRVGIIAGNVYTSIFYSLPAIDLSLFSELATMHTPPHTRYELAVEITAWIARILVCGLLLLAPWPYGMAEWSSQEWLVPVVGAVLLLSSMVALKRRMSVGNPLVWSLAFILVVGFVQVVPLPQWLWETLSPTAGFEQRVNKLADEFGRETAGLSTEEGANEASAAESITDSSGQSSARTISIHPLQTRTTLCVLAMALAMLISAGILFRDRLSVAVLLGSISLSGVAIGLLGIYQAVAAGNWTFLGDLQSTSFGTFFSRNSAPQFFACAFGATAGLMAIYHAHQTKLQKEMMDKRYRIEYPSVNLIARLRRRAEQFVTEADVITAICLVVLAVLMICVLAANSRGGTLAFFATGALVIMLYAMGRQAGVSVALIVLLLTVGSGLFLSMFGFDELIGARLDTISEEAYKRDNIRLLVWQLAFAQPSCWGLGSGLGTFQLALLPDYPKPQSVQFAHAENIYVELASNAGVITLVITLLGVGWLVWHLLTNYSNSNTAKATRFACLFSVLAIGLQNMVDFSLMLPAVFLPLAAIVGSYLGTRHQIRKKVRVKSSQHSSHSHGGRERSSHNRLQSSHGRQQSSSSRQHSVRTYQPSVAASESTSSHHYTLTGAATAETSPVGAGTSLPASASVEPPWAPAALVVCLLLISCAVAIGYRPLSGFAFAERLKVPASADNHILLEAIQIANESQWAAFPETHFEVGRLRQQLAQLQLLDSSRWPEGLSETQRASLAQPEFFSTAFHATDDLELASLRETFGGETAVLQNLRDSQFDFGQVLAACPLDWRASWGLMRGDLGELPAHERRRNYARILLSCRSQLGNIQAAGTHALMIGETAAGLRLWGEVLEVNWAARVSVFALLGRFLSDEQLVGILPENLFQRIEMAKIALEQYQIPQTSQAILATVEFDQAYERAELINDWLLVGWCAQQKGLLQQEIAAWKQAQLDDPRNHSIGYQLALAYERDGRLEAALVTIEEALQRASTNADYLVLRDRLLEQSAPTQPRSPTLAPNP